MAETTTRTAPQPGQTARLSSWIGGDEHQGGSGLVAPVFNPATGHQTAIVDLAASSDVDHAVKVARAALPAWRSLSLGRRAEILFKIRELISARREELARIVVAEHGKVLSDALGEIARGIEVIEYCCGLPGLLKGEHSQQASTGLDVHSVPHPVGVVAGITPFNFPVMVPMWMWPPALACGNTFVLKPSEKDPSASLWIARLLQEAGVPDGVFNVILGDRVAVDALLAHPDIDAVSFVGSTPVARHVYTSATASGKRAQALGGAKNHVVVLPDADMEMTADALVSAAFGSAGERCMAIAQAIVVDSGVEALTEAVTERMARIRVGDGLDPESEMGPLITAEHRDRVASYVERAPREGATVIVDGREGAPSPGFFLRPSLLVDVRPGMSTYDDEIFGPVLGVARVETYDAALGLINDNPYGNSAVIFTRDGGAARRFEVEANAGMIGINVSVPVPVAYHSFGGWKQSLFGDLHIYGPDGIRFYTKGKVVTTRWPRPGTSAVDLGFPQT
jgi:malonate-semialdehyde dehydrogenase (acetylating) / methylmalonate-semialdehyde dehydrogenase